MMPVGMQVKTEELSDLRRQPCRQPERQLGRTVPTDQQMRTLGCLDPEHARSPTIGREPQTGDRPRPWQRANERQRVDPKLRRPADQRTVGCGRVRMRGERTGPKGPSFPPATAGR